MTRKPYISRIGQSVVACLLLTSASIPIAFAQEDNDVRPLDEIVITAQKRETSLRKTSISVDASTGDELELERVFSIDALAESSLNVNFGQTTGNARIAIRGIGFDSLTLGSEARVAYHADGVYVSRPAAVLAGFFDVERIEILRGPQGTLYGRNATGGAVNVITRKPTQEREGYVRGTAGNYDLFTMEAAVGGALSKSVSARIAGQVVERGGYGDNLTTGRDVDDQSILNIRALLNFDISDRSSLLLSADYFKEDDAAYSLHYLGDGSLPDPDFAWPGRTAKGLTVGGVLPTGDRRDSTNESGPFNDREFWSATATYEYSGDNVTVSSITGYRSSDIFITTDLDATSAAVTIYNQLENADQFSQEIHVRGETDRISWLVGGYYFDESLIGGTRVPWIVDIFSPAPVNLALVQGFYAVGEVDTRAYALFASVGFQLSDTTALRIGGRYSDETKDIYERRFLDSVTPFPPYLPLDSGPIAGQIVNLTQTDSTSWSDFTPSITLEYEPNDRLFAYLTYAEGFKSGGYNVGNLQEAFNPEELQDIEAGLRLDWANGRVRTDLSVFNYDYTNLQVSQVTGAAITNENAAAAEISGVEAELTAQISDSFRLHLGLGLIDSEYTDYITTDSARPYLGNIDVSGNDLSQAPGYTGNVELIYEGSTPGGDFKFKVQGRFVDDVYINQFNLDHLSRESYSTYNAFFRWDKADSGLSVNVFVRNITDEEIVSSGLVSTALVGSLFVGTFEPPRTFGITVGYDF